MKKEDFTRLAAFISIYALLILRWGYEYGRNDQMQTLGYAKYLADKSLYPFDNYIQGIAEKVPNERFAFSWLMSWTGNMMEVFCFIGHLVFSLVLFHLLFKIAKRFVESDYLAWLCILFIFIPLYGVNLGGNELWYNTFFVSNVVKAAGLWGIWLFLNDNYLPAFLVIGLSTLLQPVVGVQLFVTFTGILLAMKVFKRAGPGWGRIIKSIFAFVITGGIWVIYLKLFFEEDAVISNALFFDILFKFRAPHHYLPFEYSLKGWIILLPLMFFGLFYYFRKEKKLGWFFGVSFLLLTVYTFLVEGFSVVEAASLQWFKMTIWLKAFSVIAMMAYCEKRWPVLKHKILQQLAFPSLALTGGIAVVIMVFKSSIIFWDIPKDFGQQRSKDPAVDICIQAQANTSDDALFIHPIAFTELKVYGERSSFVEWKILVHRKNAIKQWYDRISLLYGVGIGVNEGGFALYRDADTNFRALNATSLKKLHNNFGITHILTWKDHVLTLPIIAENGVYRIYKVE